MERLTCQVDLDAALLRLVALDERLAPFLETCQPIAIRQRPSGFGGLLQILLAQQVSVASAAAIWSRFSEAFPALDPAQLAEASEEDLRAAALSRPKVKAVKKIAQAYVDGFDPDALLAEGPEVLRKGLISLHGVGPWTADIYLLFCLGGRDVFPAGDLALQEAAKHIYGLSERPTEKAMAELAADAWQPERSAAAHLLWAVYRDLKAGRDGMMAS